uniref:Uncharacterized protein n=1 Tax=Arundo donax TaxID=35708 RepID=A0A0A9ABT0_ARUDO
MGMLLAEVTLLASARPGSGFLHSWPCCVMLPL